MLTSILIIAILILTVAVLAIIEAVLLPGVSIGAIGALLTGSYAVYYAHGEFGWIGAIIVAVIILLGIPIMLYQMIFLRKKSLVRLDTRIDSKVTNDKIDNIRVGDDVRALSRLNPMGKVTKNDDEYEARSISGFVNEGEIMTVVEIQNNCLIVKKTNN
ncbi:MAG: NfeD family protein [Bacteroidales bacterium]